MNKSFEKDIYRYYGRKKETLKEKILSPMGLKYIKCLRKCSSSNNKIKKLFYKIKLKILSKKTFIQIYDYTNIGEGLYIGHNGRVIINPKCVIGKNVNIATGVTIGQESRGKRKGCPTIGDCVWIGTNSVIVGNIKIGNDVLIAPLTFVNFNVPSHSIVIGNPARVIQKKNATEGYILNKIEDENK